MRLACPRRTLIYIATGLRLREFEPDTVWDLSCGEARVQTGEDVVKGWDASDYNSCEHHCLAYCLPYNYIPYIIVRPLQRVLSGSEKGKGISQTGDVG